MESIINTYIIIIFFDSNMELDSFEYISFPLAASANVGAILIPFHDSLNVIG